MADKKQYWKDTLQTAKSEGSRPDDSVNKRKQKKLASLHYKRRKLEKDIKKYAKYSKRVNSRAIDEIARRHGFYVEESLFRKNRSSHENA
jgi:cell division protein FtsB